MKTDKKNHRPNDILKYSGMAFEMFAFIGVGLLIGTFLDKWLKPKQPYFTLLFAVLFLSGYFVRLVKDLSKKK
ncbi:MAG: AtpZ/AtpI family protein [Saprospiraceae bacterium]